MIMLTEERLIEERRQHRRLPVRTALHCRRLGRGGFDEDVRSSDLSPGGALLEADQRLSVGDVVILEIDAEEVHLGLRGLVVAVRKAPPQARAANPEARYVHVAFTGLSPERLERLCAVLDRWEPEPA